MKTQIALAAALGLMVAGTTHAALIQDDFEVDTSANYTVLDDGNAASGDGTPDSTIGFAFDYIAAGIPLAPRSTAGDVGGLRMAANETSNDAGAADHITAYHNVAVNAAAYKLTVDVYMGVESAGGTTEFGHVGVAGNSSDFNSIFTPLAGSGHFLAFTGDGGSSSDYRHWVPASQPAPAGNSGPVNTGDLSYLNSDNTTNATGDTYQAIFAGGDFPGSPGNRWTTLEILVANGEITYSFDGTPIIRNGYDGSEGDLVSLGYADVFSSVGPHFVIYDNLSVEIVPEPASAALLGLAGLALTRRR